MFIYLSAFFCVLCVKITTLNYNFFYCAVQSRKALNFKNLTFDANNLIINKI